jgi:hypothetical protein
VNWLPFLNKFFVFTFSISYSYCHLDHK